MSKIAKIIEALEVASAHLHKGLPEDGKADYALIREALVMAREMEAQDPVAWMHWLHGPVRLYMNKDEAMLELDRLNKKYPINEGERQIRPLIFGDAAPVAQQPQAEASPTAGMNMAQRILHVGGRNNAAGYVEFGSVQAVEALVRQVVRDLPKPRRIPAHELVTMYDECPRSDSDMIAFASDVMDAMLAAAPK